MKRIISFVAALALIVMAIPIAVSAQAGILDHVVISPATANITAGGTQQFTAIAQDADNVTIADVSLAWTVENGGGSINANGLFVAGNITGAFTNTVNVTATQSSITKSVFATVIVAAPVPFLDHVIISPVTANLTAGSAQQFTAVAQDADNVTIADVFLAWTVENGGGSIDASGLFVAGNITGAFTNTVNVTATQGNLTKSAFATVIVAAPAPFLDHVIISPVTANLTAGSTQQFTAVALDADNVTIPNLIFTWTVVNGGGTVSDTGLFTAGNITGTFTNTVNVTATQGSITRSAFATVMITLPAPAQEKPPMPPGFSQGEKRGWDGNDTPPGWDNGNKNAWGESGMPPGFSKGEKNGWRESSNPDPVQPASAGQGNGKPAQTPSPPSGTGKDRSEGRGQGNGRK